MRERGREEVLITLYKAWLIRYQTIRLLFSHQGSQPLMAVRCSRSRANLKA